MIYGRCKKGDTVKVHYTGRLEDGTIFDSSIGGEPIQFKVGEGTLIEGFEESIIGMNIGESKTINIDAEKAYGPYHDELVAIIGRDRFPQDLETRSGPATTTQAGKWSCNFCNSGRYNRK